MSILTDRDIELLAHLQTNWRRHYFDELARLLNEGSTDNRQNATFKQTAAHVRQSRHKRPGGH
jgi:hypothetical protein